jgi:RNA polymerase sigma-70 factor (ECF subfamily)
VKIFKEIETYDSSKGSIKSWASRIVIHTSLNYNNRIIGINTYEIDSNSIHTFPDEIINNEVDEKEKLKNILSKMPKGYYEVFNLYVIEGFDHEEIAEILEISSQLSRKKLSRARAWLKKGNIISHIVSIILLVINWI